MTIHIDQLAFLRLTQLADSALPIGSAAHSFGLETLVAEEVLTVEQLALFLQDYLEEAGLLEATYCRLGHRLTHAPDPQHFEQDWLTLNGKLSALKTARESRVASATLGRRFLQLLRNLDDHPTVQLALNTARATSTEIHYCLAFGLAGGILEIAETATVLAYIQQTVLTLVSACQRLLPLGQSQASSIVWQLKSVMLDIAERSEVAAQQSTEHMVFTPLLDAASMRHPHLPTRLFIS